MPQAFAGTLQDIEEEQQERWEENNLHAVEEDEGRDEYYVLEMFPYPSGNLHMGHVRNFSLGDVLARYKRMQGFNVLHPMGWDAFGLPAENAAIDRDVKPGEWTFDCISTMKDQLQQLGFTYDWSREVTTCVPEYYRWNQWLFLKLLEEGLAYRGEAEVNWCPGCETVLADEQVEDGLCWRCDSVVAHRDMEQWFLRITAYAEDLLSDLDLLDGWPDKVRKMQHDWIGKSHGATIRFPLTQKGELEVFTTRPDTIYGATFMAIAPEHPLAREIAEENTEVADYIEEAERRDTAEREERTKSGVFTEQYAVNPLTNEELPLYVAEFVLGEAGTGAIMAVPAHDERDHAFAQKHGIDIQPVVEPETEWDFEHEAYEGDGTHVNAGPLNGMDNEEAISEIIDVLEENGFGEADTNFRLRDWLISRQRYWGTPIPIINCEACGAVPVPEDDLPVELPEDVEFTGTGNPVETAEDWIQVDCPSCGAEAERETDTMDTFVDSSWYFLRYADPDNTSMPFDPETAGYWMNVDQYIGGIEHAVLHLMYSRFVTKFLRDIDMVEETEPFERLLTQGMVLHESYKCSEHGWLYPEQAEEAGDGYVCSECGETLETDVIKMSKSKKNVVDPQDMMDTYGADTARVFITRAALPQKELEWSDDGVEAALRMLERVHRLTTEHADLMVDAGASLDEADLQDRIMSSHIQRAVETVTGHMEEFAFNLALERIDKLLTKLYWYVERDPDPALFAYGVRRLLEMLHPYAPHLTDHVWSEIGENGFLLDTGWPQQDEELLDAEAERIDAYHDRVAEDVREIAELVDGFDRVRIIRAPQWMYAVTDRIENELAQGERDIGSIIDTVMTDEVKQHGQRVSELVQDAAQNPGTFRNQAMTREQEDAALEQNLERWEQDFDAELRIETADNSDHDKAGRAVPGKPAIVLE